MGTTSPSNSVDPEGQGPASQIHINRLREAQNEGSHKDYRMWRGIPWGWLQGQFKKRHEGVRLRLATMKDTLFYFCPIYKLRENPKIRIRKIQKELDRLNDLLGNILNLEQLELERLWQLTVSGPWPGPLLLTCPMQAFGVILLSNVPWVSAQGLSPSPPQAGQSTWRGSLPNAALANDKCSHLRLEKN